MGKKSKEGAKGTTDALPNGTAAEEMVIKPTKVCEKEYALLAVVQHSCVLGDTIAPIRSSHPWTPRRGQSC